jgi:hypothetical protein
MIIEWIRPMIGGVLASLSLGLFIIVNDSKVSLGDMLKDTLEKKPSVSWNNQILFLIGVIVSPIIFTTFFYPVNGESLDNEPIIIILSGILVGAGFQLCKGGVLTQATTGWASSLKVSVALMALYLGFAILTQNIINLVRAANEIPI